MFDTTPSSARRTGPLRATALAIALLASATGLAACGSAHRSAAPAGAPDTIVIRNFAFQPSTLVVAPGATITVRNEDPTTHTVTSSGSAKTFDTGDIAAGATATFTAPSQPGAYPYICQIHQFMHSSLTVR
ncbi:MAG TPA: cupredoxin domain-containing protein [Acidimicrobiales bacterium]|nr:cupredoxin domain-containing protein [Acidimicrobiales bacterium]